MTASRLHQLWIPTLLGVLALAASAPAESAALGKAGSDLLPLIEEGIDNQRLNVLVCQQWIAESLHAEIWKSQTTSFFIDSAAY